jgi:hypothetical protein
MHMIGCSNPMVYRPRTVYVSISVTAFIVGGLVSASIGRGNLLQRIDAALWGAFVMWGAYLLFIHPRVIYFDEGITIVNPFRTHTLGWDRVESIEAQYSMGVQTNGKIISAWAAPAPGRYHSRSVHASEVKGMKLGYSGLIRPGESPRSDSGQASYLAKLRLEAFNEGGVDPAQSGETINHSGIFIFATLLVLALVVSVCS